MKTTVSILGFFLLLFLMFSLSMKQAGATMTVTDLKEKLKNNQTNFLLLDVRNQDEWDELHIEGARLIPVSELEARIGEIEEYKDKEVAVICRSGMRSAKGQRILQEHGFKNVENVLGGMMEWKSQLK